MAPVSLWVTRIDESYPSQRVAELCPPGGLLSRRAAETEAGALPSPGGPESWPSCSWPARARLSRGSLTRARSRCRSSLPSPRLLHQGAVEEPVLAPLSESEDLAGGRELACSSSPPRPASRSRRRCRGGSGSRRPARTPQPAWLVPGSGCPRSGQLASGPAGSARSAGGRRRSAGDAGPGLGHRPRGVTSRVAAQPVAIAWAWPWLITSPW